MVVRNRSLGAPAARLHKVTPGMDHKIELARVCAMRERLTLVMQQPQSYQF